jgi:hypothetical protein
MAELIDLTDATTCRFCHAPRGKPCIVTRGPKKGWLAQQPHDCRLVWWSGTDVAL